MNRIVLAALALAGGIIAGGQTYFIGRIDHTSTNRTKTAFERVQETGVLRCGYVHWKPYYYLDMVIGDHQPMGLNFDLMTEIGKLTGIKIEWTEEISWGNIGEGFKTNRYDAVCTSVWPDAAKIRNMNLSRPFFYSGPRLFARADDRRFDNNLEKINQPNVKVAVIDGAVSMAWVKENLPKATVVALPQMVQESEYLMTVTSKKADVLFYDLDEAAGFMKTHPDKLRLIEGLPSTRILPHVLALADPQLTQMINTALQIMIDNGDMEKLRTKYDTHYFVPSHAVQ